MFKRNFMIIIKDGSDRKEKENVISIIDMVMRRKYGKTIGHIVDETKPEMKVIMIRTSLESFYIMKDIIEKYHPGYCNFKKL